MQKLATILSFPVFFIAIRFIPFDLLPPSCAFFRTTGLPCPTCGMTRSFTALAHLQWDAAINMNPAGPVLLGLIALIWGIAVYQSVTGRKTALWNWAGKRTLLLAVIGLVILFMFGALRIWMLIR